MKKRRVPITTASLPDLSGLHKRHYGVTPPVCANYAEAAAVSLSEHHSSPAEMQIRTERKSIDRSLSWTAPGPREQAAWANRDDATRDGAYSVALASTEVELGLVAIRRASTRTGADYYLGEVGRRRSPSPNLENALRLEVSGTHGDEYAVKQRLKEKFKQTQDAKRGPAVACVVGFRERLVLLKTTASGDA